MRHMIQHYVIKFTKYIYTVSLMTLKNRFYGQKAYGKAPIVYKLARKIKIYIKKKKIFS